MKSLIVFSILLLVTPAAFSERTGSQIKAGDLIHDNALIVDYVSPDGSFLYVYENAPEGLREKYDGDQGVAASVGVRGHLTIPSPISGRPPRRIPRQNVAVENLDFATIAGTQIKWNTPFNDVSGSCFYETFEKQDCWTIIGKYPRTEQNSGAHILVKYFVKLAEYRLESRIERKSEEQILRWIAIQAEDKSVKIAKENHLIEKRFEDQRLEIVKKLASIYIFDHSALNLAYYILVNSLKLETIRDLRFAGVSEPYLIAFTEDVDKGGRDLNLLVKLKKMSISDSILLPSHDSIIHSRVDFGKINIWAVKKIIQKAKAHGVSEEDAFRDWLTSVEPPKPAPEKRHRRSNWRQQI